MQYKHLVDLIDQMDQVNKNRVQSADRKNRPESASPETMKRRNQQAKSNGSQKEEAAMVEEIENEEEEEYPEEEIAIDPDSGEDDGTNQVPMVEKTSPRNEEDTSQSN